VCEELSDYGSENWLVKREHEVKLELKLECGPMPNVMVALPNIDGALRSTLQSLVDAHYVTAVQ